MYCSLGATYHFRKWLLKSSHSISVPLYIQSSSLLVSSNLNASVIGLILYRIVIEVGRWGLGSVCFFLVDGHSSRDECPRIGIIVNRWKNVTGFVKP